jgi:hypothetical protein
MAGYVYFIGSHTFGWYKIGKAVKPTVRLSDIGILLPFRIQAIAIWQFANYSMMEQEIHRKYAGHRINGEWFGFDDDMVKQIKLEFSYAAIPHPSMEFSNKICDRIASRIPAHDPELLRETIWRGKLYRTQEEVDVAKWERDKWSEFVKNMKGVPKEKRKELGKQFRAEMQAKKREFKKLLASEDS